MLLATKGTCSEGIDLSGGTHVVLSQPGWNPMQERQVKLQMQTFEKVLCTCSYIADENEVSALIELSKAHLTAA